VTSAPELAVRTIGDPAGRGGCLLDAPLVALPVRTRLIAAGDDIVDIVARAVSGIAHPGDVIAVSETAVAIAQGRLVPAEFVRPSRLAYALSMRAGAMATVNQPESLQLVIDRVGAARVIYAAARHAVGTLLGRRGEFYRVLGEAISEIDGYTGTLPPYERTIVLGPDDPQGVAAALARRAGCEAAIVDVNDLHKVEILGASDDVDADAVAECLRGNPHGNSDQQTPVVVLKYRPDAASPPRSPLTRAAR